MPKQSAVKDARFSPDCIYCGNKNTTALIQEGSFRRCLNPSCRKQFQAKMLPAKQLQNLPAQPINLAPRHPNDYIMLNQKRLLEQQYSNQQYQPQQSPLAQQFSQPNYDPQSTFRKS